jgi:hypothetical protein
LIGVLLTPVLQPATTSAAVNSATKVIGKDLISVLEFISVTSLPKGLVSKKSNADKSMLRALRKPGSESRIETQGAQTRIAPVFHGNGCKNDFFLAIQIE